jgi:hypothetical protein
MGDGEVFRRIVLAIDAVCGIGWLAQRLEAVRASGWDIQRALAVPVEVE